MSILVTVRLLLMSIAISIHTVVGQNIPPVACPDYFQYLAFGNQFIGKITLPNTGSGTIQLNVEFAQRRPVLSNNYGQLSLYEDKESTLNSLQFGLPISYRVDFPYPTEPPKLTRITMNNVDICVANRYSTPVTVLNLQHTLQTTLTTLRNTRPLQGSFNSFDVQPSFTNTFGISNPNRVVTQSQQPYFNVFPNSHRQHNTGTVPTRLIPTSPTFPNIQPPVSSHQLPQQQVSNQQAPTQLDINYVCGREGGGVKPFIFGGTQLTRGQFPWLTAIYRKQSAGLKFLCGGSLVSAQTVVTAAHCFKIGSVTANRIVVYLGRHNLENYSEDGWVAREIEVLITHPEYNRTAISDADIALLKLQEPVRFTSLIRPICLWSEPTEASLVIDQTAYVAGWGADENGNSVSTVPKSVDARIVSEADCLRSLDAFRFLSSPRTICAGNRDGTGPCMGDSGGGLMLVRNGRWVLRGIVSAGQTRQQACNLNEYVIYCDLAKHMTWVRGNMW